MRQRGEGVTVPKCRFSRMHKKAAMDSSDKAAKDDQHMKWTYV